MRLQKIITLIAIFFGSTSGLTAEVIMRAAGRAGDHVVTSREVIINSLYEDAIYRPKSPKQIQNIAITHRNFVREATGVLLEWAIYYEAKSLNLAPPAKKDLDASVSKAKHVLRKSQAWQEQKVEAKELTDLVDRKLRTKILIQSRLSAADIPISDQEAEDYYKSNKFKFEDMPFEKLKTNIKTFLSKQQADSRMREWFELLQIKYKVRNFLAEDKS